MRVPFRNHAEIVDDTTEATETQRCLSGFLCVSVVILCFCGMDKLLIEPSGPLRGTIRVSGAKNAVLPMMAACLLTDEPSVIEQVPLVTDTVMMLHLLRRLGVTVRLTGDQLTINPGGSTSTDAPYELVNRMRASICVLGPLLAKHGRARVAMPGGCIIGPRPIDLHLKGLQALGASIAMEHGDIVASSQRLHG